MSIILQQNNCIFCKKSYKKKKDLEKHIVLCEFLNFKCKKKTKLIIEEDEDTDIPSQKVLYQMLIELGIKYNKLEEKVSDLQKMTIKENKKINIIELLNTNIYHPSIDFNNIIQHIDISEKDIEFLLDNELIDTLNNIFLRNLYHLDKSCNPIVAFIQQQNVFYIYTEKKWVKLLDDTFILFLKRLLAIIIQLFLNWKKINEKELKKNENLSLKCLKKFNKIITTDFSKNGSLSKMKNMIYDNIKVDIYY
jgi:hypothetical protein